MGLAVMILSLAITRGFKSEIREKVTGFTQDIQVQGSFSGTLATEHAVTFPDSVLESLRAIDCIDIVQTFVNKPCIIRTDKAFHGLVLKGIGPDYNLSFLKEHIVEGTCPEFTDSIGPWIMLSKETARSLGLSAGDKADVHFMQNRIRMRRTTVIGIFETGFSGYDGMTAICGQDMLQKLNAWERNEYSGLEVGAAEIVPARWPKASGGAAKVHKVCKDKPVGLHSHTPGAEVGMQQEAAIACGELSRSYILESLALQHQGIGIAKETGQSRERSDLVE